MKIMNLLALQTSRTAVQIAVGPEEFAPSRVSVYRRILSLIKMHKIVEDDDGYKTALNSKLNLDRLINMQHPSKLVYAMQTSLLMVGRDSENYKDGGVEKVLDALIETTKDIKWLLEVIEVWKRSPEVIASIARGHKWVQEVWDNFDDPEQAAEDFYNNYHKFANFIIISEEIT